jgi:competence protein ComGC
MYPLFLTDSQQSTLLDVLLVLGIIALLLFIIGWLIGRPWRP